jgi:hypothetical protein
MLIGEHKILRTLLHGTHKFIDFSHVFADDDAIVDIDEDYHAVLHVEALINLGGFETPILQSISQLFVPVKTSLLEPIYILLELEHVEL